MQIVKKFRVLEILATSLGMIAAQAQDIFAPVVNNDQNFTLFETLGSSNNNNTTNNRGGEDYRQARSTQNWCQNPMKVT